ncbi:MAG: outer membrane protein transport protein [Alphaproteobacteria bacterium]|nr:outer membrane protein transport protein [Alphaproteobacteria bacterium]MDE2629428.1 outer membrane protein transport protein [Alphaproteobacteria bacterium]
MTMRFLHAVPLCVLASGQALGAGYGLKEHSADAMAAAYAGAAATGTDASYLAYNPASLADVDRLDVSASAVSLLPNSKADYTLAAATPGTPLDGSRDPKAFIGDAVVPAIGLRYRLSQRWTAGLAVTAPWGLKTDYPAGWAGRYYAERTQLLAVNFAPTVAYQFSPRFAAGAALQVEYAKGTLTSAVDLGTLGAMFGVPGSMPGAQDGQAAFHGESWSLGFVLGAMARINDHLRIGLSYRSPVHHILRGPLTFTLDHAGVGAALRGATGLFTDTAARAAITTPDVIELGLSDRLSERWTGLAELDWTNWRRFRELRIVAANPAQPDDVTPTNWGAGWFGSLGAEYRADDRWRLRAGAGYDNSPAPQSTLGPRVPDANRIWVSLGARYRIDDATALNLTLARLFNSNDVISRMPLQSGNALRGTLAGTTKSDVTVIGIELSYRKP